MVMPDTGLLELPTSPTILAETAAKKKPKSAIINAPTNDTGTAGTSQMKVTTQRRHPMTVFIGRSRFASSSAPPSSPGAPFADLNVRKNIGSDRTSEMNPPTAIVPAPI